MTALHMDDVRHLIRATGIGGHIDIVCLLCSHLRNPKNRQKPVCSVFFRDGIPVSFNCHHCGEHGPIIDRNAARRHRRTPPYLIATQPVHDVSNDTVQSRTGHAMRIFAEAGPIAGTPAAQYLARRGLHLDTFPDDLRFHPACHFGRERVPCMVGLVRDIKTNEPVPIHRTAIKPDGRGKYFDDGCDNKLALGPVAGGAIKLTPDDSITMGLGIAEGIETCLSVMRYGWPVWSVMSASGVSKFPILSGVECLTVWADNDANAVGQNAARECGQRYAAAGIEAVVRYPETSGTDWNDLLAEGHED